ncbi:hypothetical protein J6X90_02350 [Candidatus Saccharibacteria bacterium]|nr:hypothetical protein [Candidatus Saccharibacteria bacterium]
MVLENNERVKLDTVLNAQADYEVSKIYPMHLKDADATVEVLIDTIYEHDNNYEILGKFFDDGRWYNMYFSLWKNNELEPTVKFTPWPDDVLTKDDEIYISYIKSIKSHIQSA